MKTVIFAVCAIWCMVVGYSLGRLDAPLGVVEIEDGGSIRYVNLRDAKVVMKGIRSSAYQVNVSNRRTLWNSQATPFFDIQGSVDGVSISSKWSVESAIRKFLFSEKYYCAKIDGRSFTSCADAEQYIKEQKEVR